MGSLTSRPSTPTVSSATSTTSTTTTSTVEETDAEEEAEETAAEQRQRSLLQRDRGLSGTVHTSLTGLLTPADNSSERKTLLGQ